MTYWFQSIIPLKLVSLLAPLALISVGAYVEKHFVGRITTFANVLALNIFFFSFQSIPTWLVWYLNIGIIFAVFGFASYIMKESLPQAYYSLNLPYCSIVSGLVLFYGLISL
jgi:hypothetical protein